jgi:hypothetical protein
MACKLLGQSWWPENYAQAYEPTLVPLMATLAGGILAVLATVWNENRRKPSSTSEGICRST